MVLPLDRAKREGGTGTEEGGRDREKKRSRGGRGEKEKGETDIKETGDQDVHVLRNSCRAREI
jgi:hypothetical protein